MKHGSKSGSRPIAATFRAQWFATLLLILHAGLLAWSGWRHSPTYDEVGHLPAGLAVWEYGRFDLYRVNPPLVRAVAAAPVWLAGCEYDWRSFSDSPAARPEWAVGADFIAANGSRSFWLFTLARWACVPFSLLGGWVCWRWAGALYGNAAGIVALALWCFSPDVLGNGSLITPDVPAAALGLLAGYAFWKWLIPGRADWSDQFSDAHRHWWATAIVAGIALGAAELAKFTWVILFALWPLLWIATRALHERRGVGQPSRRIGVEALQLTAILAIALYVLNLGYAFEGTLLRLDEYAFVSRTLGGAAERDESGTGNRFTGTSLAELPVPLPREYVTGIDLQKKDFEDGKVSYLRGEFRHGGWWHYYLYAAAVKLPVGMWLLAGVSLVMTLRRWWTQFRTRDRSGSEATTGRGEWLLLVPAAVVFVLVSSQTGFNRYFRYVLPALPFLFVWMSQAALLWQRPAAAEAEPSAWSRAGGGVALIALCWTVGSSLWYFPHSLSYFNELAGGPRHGDDHLIDANIDWGQDLFYLREWIAAHPEARPLTVAWMGFFDERIAGVDYPRTPTLPSSGDEASPAMSSGGPEPGWHAVSVNFLRHPSHAYDYLHAFESVAYPGYSIRVYHLTEQDVETLSKQPVVP